MRDLLYPWAHLIHALLGESIINDRLLNGDEKTGNESWIETSRRLAEKAQQKLNQAIRDWLACILRYRPDQPLVQSHIESFAILKPSYQWPDWYRAQAPDYQWPGGVK